MATSNTNYYTTVAPHYTAQPQPQAAMVAQPLNILPYYYYYTGGTSGGSTAPPAATAPTPSAPASPTSSASDLQVLIASIPIAQDGQVISAEYHNNLRAALIAMANRLGLGTISEEITITNAPRLIGDGSTDWKADIGMVKKASATTGALHGWMELDLPDGARIKKMQVFAANDSAGTMKLKLRRQSVSSSNGDNLIEITVSNNDAATAKEGDVTLPGSTLGAAAIEETRIVDNRNYKYLFVADLEAGVSGKEASILSVQIICGK